MSAKHKVIALIIVVSLISIAVYFWMDGRAGTNQEMTAKGCYPLAFNSLGGVTSWSCPAEEGDTT